MLSIVQEVGAKRQLGNVLNGMMALIAKLLVRIVPATAKEVLAVLHGGLFAAAAIVARETYIVTQIVHLVRTDVILAQVCVRHTR